MATPSYPRLLVLSLSLLAGASQAGFTDQFKDPTDGRVDASQWILNNAHGFMPVPILITEPAVGVGGGAALLFFHESESQRQKRLEDPLAVAEIPPSVTGVVAAGTNNGTKLGGLFHSGNWLEDRVRYLGGIFAADLKLKAYTGIDAPAMGFSLQGWHLFQDIDVRLGESNFFLGGEYSYTRSEAEFDLGGEHPLNQESAMVDSDGALGVKLTYDSTDNHFSPRSGIKARLKSIQHDKRLGGDFDYRTDSAFLHAYHRLNAKWGVNMSLDAKSLSGDAPFYALPYLDMRGMPAMRYQGDDTALGEVEVSYDLDDRWTLLGFAGAGKALMADERFADSPWLKTQGVGFRYLMARQLGLRTGMDIAKGPEEWTLYLQVGGAW
ncbi:BamA/TamA family outer membrane protein [Shewanella alkalitolerans]|uniref:BamA/TamA family outer membrane protein n=1 Tax=Shewanella alkalitolerans TaxID=2864209 RepID=UPI001C65E401|nr:BamA/TamA family outer membrane protein [Shewanella alkalitolerans]QYJ97633.1 BamA/TamA family outer membrane protein [Shewanella alkalitolerans]